MRRLRLPGAARAATAAALAAVVTAGVLGACDASPWAAQVGGTTIKSAALNAELGWSAQATDYSSTIAGQYSQVNSTSLTVAGQTANSYSAGWTAYTLTQMIQGAALAQAVAARHALPTSDLYTAALGGIEIESLGATGSHGNGGITQMNSAYLVELTQRLADHASIEPPLSTGQLQPYYTNYLANFYTQVCIRQATVTAYGANGAVDYTKSRTQALSVAAQMASGQSGVGGSANCYTHEQLDAQAASVINAVVALAPGHAGLTRTSAGYQVTYVASRNTLPLAGPVAQVLTALVYDLQGPTHDSALQGVLASAHVRVNPGYGSWGKGVTETLAVVSPTVGANVPQGGSSPQLADNQLIPSSS